MVMAPLDLLKPGAALESLGWPLHLQSMKDKISSFKKEPSSLIVAPLEDVPFTTEIEEKIQGVKIIDETGPTGEE
jgi:hypothetical protein